jgi:hypothetical protein
VASTKSLKLKDVPIELTLLIVLEQKRDRFMILPVIIFLFSFLTLREILDVFNANSKAAVAGELKLALTSMSLQHIFQLPLLLFWRLLKQRRSEQKDTYERNKIPHKIAKFELG